jgi:hypothetical protein
MGGTGAPVDELVGLLAEHAPSILEELRAAHPEHRRILEVGVMAGPAEDDDRIRADLTVKALNQISLRAVSVCHHLSYRTTRADQFELYSQILATVSTAGLLGVLAADLPRTAEYVGAAAALLGTVCALIAGQFKGKATKETETAFSAVKGLAEAIAEAEWIARDLRAYLQSGHGSVAELIGRGNKLARDMRVHELLWMPPRH